MILFISNNESINFENNQIKKVKLKAEAIKINVKNFKSKATAIIVDEEYISSNPELFEYLKDNLQNQLIINKTSDNEIDYPYIIDIKKEENIDIQLEKLIRKIKNPDIENEEKTSKNKKFKDNNKKISQEIKDMISQLSSQEIENQESKNNDSADETDELSFNNILEKENRNESVNDDVEQKSEAEAIKINVKNFKSKAMSIIFDEEFEKLIRKIENPDIENEEKTSKNKKFKDNNKKISQEIKDMINQLSSQGIENQESKNNDTADETDELSFNNILEKENRNENIIDDVEEKSEVVKTQDEDDLQEEKKDNIHPKDSLYVSDMLKEILEEKSKTDSYALTKSDLLKGFDNITKANNSNNFTSKNSAGDNRSIEDKKLANLEKIARRKAEEKEKKKKQQEKNNIVVTKIQENKSPKQEIDLETIDAVKHDVDIQKKKESELKNLIDGFEDAAHVKKEKIDEYLNKQYSPTSQNDNIYMSVNSVQKEKKFDFKIPKFGGIKSKKDEDTLSSNMSVSYNQNFIMNTNGEIAVVGGLKGVGTTYCCFKIANSYPNKKVAYVQYIEDDIEISILKEAKEKGYINDNINIYSSSEKLSAYQNNDIVIVDYGYFDKFNNTLILDFERASNKYFVVNYSFNKFTSINNAISYSEYNPNFITIFNMYDETQLINLQKEFKDLNIQIFGFRNLI